jgi:hypothetical protein
VEEGQCGGHPPLLREVREARKHKIINKYKNNLFSIQYRQLSCAYTVFITCIAWAETVDVVLESF